MASATITIRDTDTGTVKVEAVFNPPISNGLDMTPAQEAALYAMEGITSKMPEATKN